MQPGNVSHAPKQILKFCNCQNARMRNQTPVGCMVISGKGPSLSEMGTAVITPSLQ